MEDQNYKPNIARDKEYLNSLASKISAKAALEEIRFEYLTDALTSLGIQENPYDFVSLEGNDVVSIQKIAEKAFEIINTGSLDEKSAEHLYRLWDYLAKSDELQKADLIYVFGGAGLERVKEAVSLLKEGFANKILFTGQRAAYMKDVGLSEAEYYAQEARKLGVKDDQMILETKAINTVENAVNSAKIFKEMDWLPNSLILLTLPYHMRRAYLTFKSVADWKPHLICHPVASEKYTKENYFKDIKGWSYVFFEYLKIYGARQMKHF